MLNNAKEKTLCLKLLRPCLCQVLSQRKILNFLRKILIAAKSSCSSLNVFMLPGEFPTCFIWPGRRREERSNLAAGARWEGGCGSALVGALLFPPVLLCRKRSSRRSSRVGLGRAGLLTQHRRLPLLAKHPLAAARRRLGGGSGGARSLTHTSLPQNGQRVETCRFPRVLLGRWGTLAADETISSCGEPSVNSPWARCPAPLVFLARNPRPPASDTKLGFCQP